MQRIWSELVNSHGKSMLIINADDFGRSAAETDAALRCFEMARLTSVSAMVFMADSERAADLAKQTDLDVGLHLNFTERFTGGRIPATLANCHNKIARFLTRNRYSQVLYNPFLRREFSYSYEAQVEEFTRLFGKAPSHIDGHHHMHLCGNMLLTNLIPSGMRVRRNFSFWPGEKTWLNRAYRAVVDRWLARRYRLTDYFFDLTQSIREKKMDRVMALAESCKVELMTHPIYDLESDYLMSNQFQAMLQRVNVGGYALV
jgi:chitin disaccharide deacetylase